MKSNARGKSESTSKVLETSPTTTGRRRETNSKSLSNSWAPLALFLNLRKRISAPRFSKACWLNSSFVCNCMHSMLLHFCTHRHVTCDKVHRIYICLVSYGRLESNIQKKNHPSLKCKIQITYYAN